MLRTDENETEILLGNKQLLGVFLVVAVLLGISFTGGYMAGRGSGKKTALSESAATEAVRSDTGTGGQTHTVSPDAAAPDSLKSSGKSSGAETASERDQGTKTSEQPLGARRRNGPKAQPVKELEPESAQAEALPASSGENYTPHSGSQYLQVAAVGRDEAQAIADVLRKKGFRAHAVPKPGSNKLYRVIIGPIRDAGDLRSTRDALHNTAGFREVIVQHY
ncbi:MAG: SPOR domain-containing protein [Bryobacteraceae bacterium]